MKTITSDYLSNGTGAVWLGRSGITMHYHPGLILQCTPATHQSLWFIHIWAQRPREGDEHPTSL